MKITNINELTEYALNEIPEFYDLPLFEKFEKIEALLNGLHEHELISVYNDEAIMSLNFCLIHPMSELNISLLRRSPVEIIQMTIHGSVNLNEKYFMVDDLGDLYTGDCLTDFSGVDIEELAKDIVNYHLDV